MTSKNQKYLYNADKRILNNLQQKCIEFLIKSNHNEKLETLDVYGILKIFIFEQKKLNLIRALFTKVPTLAYFEENPIIITKILDKFVEHLYDDINKKNYYSEVLNFLLNVKNFKISKDIKLNLTTKLEMEKVNVKNSDIERNKKKDIIKSIDSLLIILKTTNGKTNTNIINLNKKYNILTKFNNQIIKSSQSLIPSCSKSYVDETDMYTVSIDCKGTNCIDDAFSLKKTKNGNYILEVYITDLTPYIRRRSDIDIEAQKRGYTIFLPNNYIPMLPNNLCDDTLSLKKNKNKYAVAHRFEFSENMDLISFDIYNAIINVNKNYDYDTVNHILQNGKNKEEFVFLRDVLEFNDKLNELRLFNDEYYDIKHIKRTLISGYTSCEFKDNCLASQIISNIMVLTNYFESQYFANMNIPFIYCINESTNNKQIIDKIKLQSTESQNVSQILKLINESYLSSQYSLNNKGHCGLGVNSYCHSTNPIRNYASLTIQRIEQDFLMNEKIDDILFYAWEDYLKELIEHLNNKKNENRQYSYEYYRINNKKKK